MARVSIAGVGPLVASQEDALVGLTDMSVQITPAGPVLYVVTRGGGYLTGYSLGNAPGGATQQDSWAIPSSYLQLTSTDLTVVPDGAQGDLLLVGMNSSAIQGVDLSGNATGNQFSGNADYTAPGVNMGDVTTLEMLPADDSGLASMRGGGLQQFNFSNGAMDAQNISMSAGLQTATASAIATADVNGQGYAFVSYGSEDKIAVLREGTTGQLAHVSTLSAGNGFWVDRPGDLSVVEGIDGKAYVIVTASGTGSLSVLQLDPANGALTPVDHVLDSLDTRFSDASHVESFEVDGQPYVLASGSDDGLSLFAVLPGGRLQLIDTIEGTAALPLNGITGIEVLPGQDGARVWVSTQGPPYLTEFALDMSNPGISALASGGGGTLSGGGGDDILSGQGGADTINGGNGDDLIMDGAGADRMTGGAGADEFIFVIDGARDVIVDFQPGIDRIDLTSFGVIGHPGELQVISRSYGAELRIGDEIIEVHRAGGGTLTVADFGSQTLVGLDRVSLDEAIIINPPEPPPPPPPPPDPDATQLPGPPPTAPKPLNAPVFVLPNAPPGSWWGTDASESIDGFEGHDHVRAGNGDDVILTYAGDDTVTGEGGNDQILGWLGSDLLFGEAGRDTLEGADGQDTLIGGESADSLLGGDGHDFLLGGGGADQIFGGSGDDFVWAGDIADRVWGGDGNDWLSAGSSLGYTVDGVWGELGDDTIFGDPGFDMLDGGPGNDVIDGGNQADNIYGGTGDDTLFGGQGLDRLFAGEGNDMLYGGLDNDGHFGGAGDDSIWGGSGNDRAFGEIGNDIIDGGDGIDTLYGGAGFDTLVGGAGDDVLQGNFNADRFVFADGHGGDRITDFEELNIYEKIDLSGVSAITNMYDLMSNHVTQVGANVVIDTGGGNSITLNGVLLSDLDHSDFVF